MYMCKSKKSDKRGIFPCTDLAKIEAVEKIESQLHKTKGDVVWDALQKRAAAAFDISGRLEKFAVLSSANSGSLTEEDDNGGVEYKWKLTDVTPSRFEHLLTQLRFRVAEGNGQCLYELGVANDGSLKGLPLHDYKESVGIVQKMAKKLDFDATVLQEFYFFSATTPLWCGEILVTQQQARQQQDGSVAFCGSVGSGKSTLIGVLLKGVLDDGIGSARQALFNHRHEVGTGRTTSLVTRVLHIVDVKDEDGAAILPGENECGRLLTAIDLGGGVTKILLSGLMSWRPNITGICLSVEQRTEEVVQYARLCHALRFLFFIIVTKVDTISDFEFDDFLLELAGELSSIGYNSVFLSDVVDVDKFQHSWKSSNQVPILCVSSVTGFGLKIFRHFLSSFSYEKTPVSPDAGFEVFVNKSFFVCGVGPVVCGRVVRGTVKLGCRCCIGPDAVGKFHPVIIQGIHVDGSHVTCVQRGDEATFALSELVDSVDMSQKGKLLTSSPVNVAWTFGAHIALLSREMTPRLQPILYQSNLRQVVKIVSSLTDVEAYTKGGLMYFQFLYHPEVIREGDSFVLNWGSEGMAIGNVRTVSSIYFSQED